VTSLADILRHYGPVYIKRYASRMLPSHKRAIGDIILCRTPRLGGQTWYCDTCKCYHYSYHSCRNRHCPKCQNDRASEWLDAQRQRLLPVPYFMATVTVPEALRGTFRSDQKVMYSIFFRTSAEAIQTLAQDRRFIGGTIGMIGVLQTWTRDLAYHPHIHFLIPGCGLSENRKKLRRAKKDFLVHVKPLSVLIRAKFRDACTKAGLFDQIPKSVWKKHWVVHIEPVGTGEAALKYLAPYIFRVAISDRNIVSLRQGHVSFRYKDSQTKHFRLCSLDALEFIRRFLEHVLPKGLVKVRYFGFLATKKRALLNRVKELLEVSLCSTEKVHQRISKSFRCPTCGRTMAFIADLPPRRGPPLNVLLHAPAL
jgi:hypothetical protein